MNKKFLRRLGAIAVAATVSAGALMLFAGCTTDHPEVTITYAFNGKEYKVDYRLSRVDAPKTVQHFIELADAGFYDGLCIHNYDSNYLYGGGYELVDGQNNRYDYKDPVADMSAYELREVDYFTRVQALEEAGKKFTQSVWAAEGTAAHPKQGAGLYTVYGEQGSHLENPNRELSHGMGALVMYYTDKGSNSAKVTVVRSDGGKDNDGEPLQHESYTEDSATSLFYTYTSASINSSLAEKYCVFGVVKDLEKFNGEDGLLQAIRDYIEQYEDDENFSFTTEQEMKLNEYDPFEEVKRGDLTETFNVPLRSPIIIASVKVNKY